MLRVNLTSNYLACHFKIQGGSGGIKEDAPALTYDSGLIDVCSFANEELDNCHVTILRGDKQWSCTILQKQQHISNQEKQGLKTGCSTEKQVFPLDNIVTDCVL